MSCANTRKTIRVRTAPRPCFSRPVPWSRWTMPKWPAFAPTEFSRSPLNRPSCWPPYGGQQDGRFKGLLENSVGANAGHFGIVHRLHGTGREKHGRGAVRTRIVFRVFAQLIAGDFRHGDVGDDDAGLRVFKAQHGDQTVA